MLAVTLNPSLMPFIHGFLLCASTIIALGPQNMFVLRQGLRRQHVFATALFSSLADVVLIMMAVGGLSAVISSNNHFRTGITVLGVMFLIYIGIGALRRACRKGEASPALISQPATSGIRTTIIATLCFAFLNPGVYVDTLMVIGSTSLNFAVVERLSFAIGAVMASTTWFFTLSYGASKLGCVDISA